MVQRSHRTPLDSARRVTASVGLPHGTPPAALSPTRRQHGPSRITSGIQFSPATRAPHRSGERQASCRLADLQLRSASLPVTMRCPPPQVLFVPSMTTEQAASIFTRPAEAGAFEVWRQNPTADAPELAC